MSELTADYHYDLPAGLIAQTPAERRDGSRLLVLDRATGRIEHRQFPDLADYLAPGDLLVVNDSRVIPARLRGTKSGSGGQIEILLTEENGPNDWWVMLRPGKRVRAGTTIRFSPPAPRTGPEPSPLAATVLVKESTGLCRLRFETDGDVRDRLDAYGEVPLPPYIERTAAPSAEDRARYQTVFAQPPGSVAAPTAGLHFTESFLGQLRASGVRIASVTLHVGLGTFAPVKATRLQDHLMHHEWFSLPEATAEAVNETRRQGRRIVAVGTTSVRVLESAARQQLGAADPADATPPLRAGSGRTNLFLHPPASFRVVDALLTNFHLPESTLLMLVCAFATPSRVDGRATVLEAYRTAVAQGYRFFSYGDAMFLR